MTFYTIYAIVNTANNMRYIGQSKRPMRRKIRHFSELKNNKHPNSYLQRAYHKYGRNVFIWEVLEDNIQGAALADEREMYWIAQFDSVYNMTNGGDSASNHLKQSCVWNDIRYESISDAAIALDIPTTTMKRYIDKGYVRDSDIHIIKRIVVWNEITYRSLNEAANAIGVTRKTMRDYLKRGFNCDADLSQIGREIPVIWNEVEYPSIRKAAMALGIHETTMKKRVDSGYTKDEDIPKFGEWSSVKCTWNGIEYKSIAEAARMIGVPNGTMYDWITRGYTCDSDVPNRKP